MESDDNFDEDLTEAGGSLVANEEMGQIRENIQQKIEEFNLAVASNPENFIDNYHSLSEYEQEIAVKRARTTLLSKSLGSLVPSSKKVKELSKKRQLSESDEMSSSGGASRPMRMKHKVSDSKGGSLEELICSICAFKTYKRPLEEARRMLLKHQENDLSCLAVRSRQGIVEKSQASK